MKYSGRYLAVLLSVCITPFAQATCIKVTASSQLSSAAVGAGYTASSWSGACATCTGKLEVTPMLSIGSGVAALPSGTLLSSATANFLTAGVKTGYNANQVLFRCESTDADSLFEMYATNGGSPYAGKYEVEDIEGAYYTFAKNVALRVTNLKTGLYYSRYWQSRQLSPGDLYDDGKYIYIPASAFSDAMIEIFKTDQISYWSNASSQYAFNNPTSNAFVVFKGPGMLNAITDGGDSASQSDGFYTYWPAAWSLYQNVTVARGAMCLLRDYTPQITFPLIGAAELNSGITSQQPFSITLDCDPDALSGVTGASSSPNVAVGFLVNQQTALNAASTLGLVNASGGVSYLLDNQYGEQNIASGVGIKIYDKALNAINLLSSRATGGGNSAGWYAYKDITEYAADNDDGTVKYIGDFISSLEALPGNQATAGSVDAQLQVVVSFQ
ncbi:fimbrial usher protein StbD [Mangrovibacter plantisponsor]|uniref:Fimbrial protein n=1 Tax=Mangrovibacter plantisponsor TaxID=451513 RepID=A0A317PXU2_9ENTR|nr:fimbrial usher protein StbD [Mangrovibacter plantisponsor]PWW07085.1 fimbrial protein [Mangrovibacter plantisponsor]